MEKIIIFDTTLRDGEQAPGASLTSSQKMEVACQLEKLGVDIIEAGFPIASPDDFKAMLDLVNEHKIVPVIDEVFPLKDGDSAVKKMENSSQFGKIVLTV